MTKKFFEKIKTHLNIGSNLHANYQKKGFPPLCIQSNQPNHIGIDAGAEAAQSRPKETIEKEQKKQMPTTADQQKRRSLAIAAPTGIYH